MRRIRLSVAANGWTWGGGERGRVVGGDGESEVGEKQRRAAGDQDHQGLSSFESDSIDVILFRWADHIRCGNDEAFFYSHAYEFQDMCLCHLSSTVWPLQGNHFHQHPLNKQPPLRSYCEIYEAQRGALALVQEQVPEFVNAMNTILVLSSAFADAEEANRHRELQQEALVCVQE